MNFKKTLAAVMAVCLVGGSAQGLRQHRTELVLKMRRQIFRQIV